MDELRAYADRRLELADMIRAALHSARGSEDEQAENEARDLLSRLAADTFRLAVVGQFSRGKTTLMNALLGGPFPADGCVADDFGDHDGPVRQPPEGDRPPPRGGLGG
jgi:ATPase subunit of ABC transporter with duplicated ATPase domains